MIRELKKSEMAAPGTPAHQKIVTASKVPAILGVDPYRTTGDLWMEMSGMAPAEEPDDETAEMWAFGHDAEAALAESWKRHNPGWQLNRGGELAYTNDALPFLNQATIDRRAMNRRVGHGLPGRFHILEFKVSASWQKWGDPGDEVPADVAVQHIFQMGVSGIHQGSIVVLAGYDRPVVPRFYEVAWDQDIFDGLVDVAAEFEKSLGRAEPPMPDPALMEALAAARRVVDLDGEMELDPDDLDLAEIRRLDRAILELQDDRRQHVDALVARAGGRHLLLDGKKITKRTAGRFSQSRVPEEARHLLKDPRVQSTSFDAKKFQSLYPEAAAAATGDDSLTIPTLKES